MIRHSLAALILVDVLSKILIHTRELIDEELLVVIESHGGLRHWLPQVSREAHAWLYKLSVDNLCLIAETVLKVYRSSSSVYGFFENVRTLLIITGNRRDD